MGELIQMAVLSTTVGKNPIEEIEHPRSTRVQTCAFWGNLKNDGMTVSKEEEGYLGAGLKI